MTVPDTLRIPTIGGAEEARCSAEVTDLGRVKTLGRQEHMERRSSSATMSSQAMASPHGNRGTGTTRFPSV